MKSRKALKCIKIVTFDVKCYSEKKMAVQSTTRSRRSMYDKMLCVGYLMFVVIAVMVLTSRSCDVRMYVYL